MSLAMLLTAAGLTIFEHRAAAMSSTNERMYIVRKVQAALSAPDSKIDLASAKLAFDKIADPTVDIDANLKLIQKMTADIRTLAGPMATKRVLVTTLRTYLYESGDWNAYKPFQYDLSDPLGTRLPTRLLPYYLTTRRGNCVSMPILFVILADRLGLHATLALAPQHLFVKYTDDVSGKTFNIEATSGGHAARDEWYRQNMSMSDAALTNGIYMRPLSRKEEVVVMAQEILEFDMAAKRYQEVVDVADEMLTAYPNFVDAMLFQGTASGLLAQAEFRSRYARADQIPEELRPRFLALQANNKSSFEKAESLGWRETDGQAASSTPQK
jgi:regulator of sirC expression with transglutaminase-like and TPR domain